MIVGDGVRATDVDKVSQALTAAGAVLQVIGPRGGTIGGVEIHHTFHTCDSVMFDALVVDPSAALALAEERKVAVMVQEAYRHHKAVGALGDGAQVLDEAGVLPDAPGVVVGPSAAKAFTSALVTAVGWHRHWDRVV
jgi:catalase